MKKITLAPKLRRMLASLIDLVILLTCTIVTYLLAVMPFVFDADGIKENDKKAFEYYQQCSLYITDDEGNALSKNEFPEIKKLEDFYNVKITFKNKEYNDVSLSKSLYTFYTEQYQTFGAETNLSKEVFETDILKLGSLDSNIQAYDNESGRYTLIDAEKEGKTLAFVRSLYRKTTDFISTNSPIAELGRANAKITTHAILFILPVIIGFSFIFNFLIPICSPNGQSIGKWIFGFIVLDKNGYYLPKIWYLPRWLVYIGFEIIGGICTFGGCFLISYTMFMFNRKRRCLHDYAGKSVVADGKDTIFFKNPEEEQRFKERYDKYKRMEACESKSK